MHTTYVCHRSYLCVTCDLLARCSTEDNNHDSIPSGNSVKLALRLYTYLVVCTHQLFFLNGSFLFVLLLFGRCISLLYYFLPVFSELSSTAAWQFLCFLCYQKPCSWLCSFRFGERFLSRTDVDRCCFLYLFVCYSYQYVVGQFELYYLAPNFLFSWRTD